MRFQYAVIRPDGRRTRGTVHAEGIDDAKQELLSKGNRILELRALASQPWFRLERKRSASTSDVAAFALELSQLLDAGASLRGALRIQTQGESGPAELASIALARIEAGHRFSASFENREGPTALLTEFLNAAERGAGLSRLLGQAAHFLGQRAEAKRKISSALSYPTFIIGLAIVAVMALVLIVAPALEPLVMNSDEAVIIRHMANLGAFLKTHASTFYLLLATVVAGVFIASKFGRVRRAGSAVVWRLPLIGQIVRNLSIGEAFGVLGALLRSGQPLETSLRTASFVAVSELRPALVSIADALRDGTAASDAFGHETRLPLDLRRLALIGEQSSSLEQALSHGGQLCHGRALATLDRVSSTLGPAFVIVMGAAIALLMVSVLGAIGTLGDATL